MTNSTQRFAHCLYHRLKKQIGKKAIIIALEGPLGAGKTTFAKAFAKALGITETVVSPTFTLHGEYRLLDHIDLWRVDDPAEFLALGVDQMVARKRVIIIEWAEKVKAEIKKLRNKDIKLIWIKLAYGKKANERIISIT